MLASQLFDRRVLLAWLLAATAACADGTSPSELATVTGQLGAGITSDDFHTGTLNPLVWQVTDPQGDGTVSLSGSGTSDARLQLSVPAGTTHDAWSNNTALRVMQPAADEDFAIEVKFESEPTQKYQGQGLLVEQDAANYLRFDVHSDGRFLKVFVSSFTGGSPTVVTNRKIAEGATTYLRLSRVGEQWSAEYSYDGSSWAGAASFSHAMTVSSVGIFASNYDPNPAYTAVVDYFFETSSPVDPEDPSLCDPNAEFVLTTQATNGSIARSPDLPSYSCGDIVTLAAQPDVGASFAGWGGDLSGTANPVEVMVSGDMTVSAMFDLDMSPPQITGVEAAAAETSAAISWQTDEPSVGFVEYGLTTSYEIGSVASSTPATMHAIELTGLSEGQLYHFRVTAEDNLGHSGSAPDGTFTTSVGGAPGGASLESDDFRESGLNASLWQVVDPRGDGTVAVVGSGTSNAQLLLSVPAGSSHDPWTTNQALRVMQPAADEDFEIEAKFESLPSQKYQSQGLLVEQDAANYVRFDVHSDGTSLKVFGATLKDGSAKVRVSSAIASGPTTYLRLSREGDQWTAKYSYDGLMWATASSFTHALTVSSAGVFAGNHTPNPAYTAVVDYFFETSSPIDPEDPLPCDPTAQFVLNTEATNGSIARSPDLDHYGCGDVVTLTALPDAGATFTGWGGALSGASNPVQLAIEGDATVSATFDVDTTPPQISGIQISAEETSAAIGWQTDEASTGLVEYGLTTAYELGLVSSSTLATGHNVELTGLSEGQLYHYRIIAEDELGNGASSDSTFTTASSSGGDGDGDGDGDGSSDAILSDDFRNGVLNSSLWQVVDPQADGTVQLVGAGTPDAQLLLSVPAGTSHDAWSTNTSLRVMQPAADEDFEIEVKFESEPSERYQSQGVLVEQDPSNYIRFDIHSDGSSLRVFSATLTDGAPTVRVNAAIPAGPTTYLRLTRSGDQWTAQYSYDGSSWTTATSFSHPMMVWSVGVFAGNFDQNPAYTAVVDYFFETSSPIEPEDAPLCSAGEQFQVTTTANGPGAIVRTPDKSTYACGELLTLTAQPGAGAAFLGWGGALGGTANPVDVLVNADTEISASFALDTTPPQIRNVDVAANGGSASVSWDTDETSTGVVEYGVSSSYELGAIASNAASTSHTVVLPDLTEGQLYHYRIIAEDGLGNSTVGAGATFVNATGGPDIEVWHGASQSFGQLGNPQVWVNVLGQVQDPDGIASLTYSLNGGPAQSLGIGPFKRLSQPGDFNVELHYQELLPGLNTIEIRAVDGVGLESMETVTVDYSAGNVWPLDYQIDWSTADEINDVAQIVDGRWSIVNGELRNDIYAYDRLVTIGDLSWTDYEITVPVTVHSISQAGFGGENGTPGVGVMLRWPGHYDWDGSQPNWGYYPIGGGGWVRFETDGTGELRLDDFTPGGVFGRDHNNPVMLGTTYIWKVRAQTQPGGTSLYQIKTWPAGTPEPAAWQLSDTETTDVAAGGLLLIAHFADVTFGNIVITPL